MKKSTLMRAAAIAVASCTGDTALAGEKGPGPITDLQVQGNMAIFAVGGPAINRPACAVWERFTIDVSTSPGQTMLANLLSAQATSKRVIVDGTGSCSHAADHEAAGSGRDGQ